MSEMARRTSKRRRADRTPNGATTYWEDKMFEETKARKINLGFNWIQAESGNTYLCPAGKDFSGATETELRAHCVNESLNPQND